MIAGGDVMRVHLKSGEMITEESEEEGIFTSIDYSYDENEFMSTVVNLKDIYLSKEEVVEGINKKLEEYKED